MFSVGSIMRVHKSLSIHILSNLIILLNQISYARYLRACMQDTFAIYLIMRTRPIQPPGQARETIGYLVNIQHSGQARR